MSYSRFKKINRIFPQCIFCNNVTEPTIIFCTTNHIIRGWKCPKCGFTLIHPHEIPKALDILKKATKNLYIPEK